MSREEIERLDDQGMAAWDGHDAEGFANLFADKFAVNDVAMPERITTKEGVRQYLLRGTAELPEAPDNVAIIGCDAANGTYFQLYSDERGVCRIYEMSIGNGEWKLWRAGEPFSQRFTATFSDDGNTITGRWEIAEDGSNYTTDFDLIYRRVDT